MKSNYTFNNPEEDLQNAIKTSAAALDLSKTDDTHGTNDLIYSPTANTAYDKTDLRWRLSPKTSSPSAPATDGKFRKSPTAITNSATTSPPFTAASTANILLSNCMNQIYPRPNLGFHSHARQHSISKHFHNMLNQHTNFLQSNSIAFDRTSISGSLNLTAGYNHSHHDAIASVTSQQQQHHMHQS